MLKNIKLLSMFAFVALLAVNIAYSAEIREASFQTNLHCGSCASKIQKGLNKTAGVIETNADIATKIVTVKYDTEKTDDTKLKQVIADMGYKVDENTADKKCSKTTDKECCKTTGKECTNKDKTSKMSGKDCCDTKATKSSPSK